MKMGYDWDQWCDGDWNEIVTGNIGVCMIFFFSIGLFIWWHIKDKKTYSSSRETAHNLTLWPFFIFYARTEDFIILL